MPDYARPLDQRATVYCEARGLVLAERLGFGKDGTVWATTGSTAVKAHERRRTYERERDVYARLASRGCDVVAGHRVPVVVEADDGLGVIEMTIVKAPFVLDFASAQLDQPYDFPPEILAEWYEAKRRDFGANWGRAVAVLRELERMGIYMVDVHPGNIGFPRVAGEAAASGSGSSGSWGS
jgi:hypothetical protein